MAAEKLMLVCSTADAASLTACPRLVATARLSCRRRRLHCANAVWLLLPPLNSPQHDHGLLPLLACLEVQMTAEKLMTIGSSRRPCERPIVVRRVVLLHPLIHDSHAEESDGTLKACCHCSPFSHALMAAEKLMPAGSTADAASLTPRPRLAATARLSCKRR